MVVVVVVVVVCVVVVVGDVVVGCPPGWYSSAKPATAPIITITSITTIASLDKARINFIVTTIS